MSSKTMNGFGAKMRSRRVVLDSSMIMATIDVKGFSSAQSCWAKIPHELLREVLVRIEKSESSWPLRRNVVACAGVCKSWRDIVKDIVKTPKLSGKLTFPVSLKQPGPRDTQIRCLITRNRSKQTFHLYLNSSLELADDGKFLLAARKVRRPTCTDYIFSIHPNDFSKGCIGKLRSNYSATKFNVKDALPPHAGEKTTKRRSFKLFGSKQISPKLPCGNFPVAHVSYELNALGFRGPRKIQCIMDAIPASAVEPGGMAPIQTEFPLCRYNSFPSLNIYSSKSGHIPLTKEGHGALVLRNKSPRWYEQQQCWCLNFNGRVTIASVKNFQLVAAPREELATPECENIILQFGKVAKDVFTMDYSYPLSAFQAFAICLSSFETKVACHD